MNVREWAQPLRGASSTHPAFKWKIDVTLTVVK